jgi:hypothetical protein
MDARLREGIRLFNAGRYFESHESLEEFYRRAGEEHKAFVEGLVQLATALRLFCEFAEVKGPVRMARQAIIRLENFSPAHLGIKVNKLIRAMERWAEETESGGAAARGKLPKIRLRLFF